MPSTLYQLFTLYHRQLGYGLIAATLAVLRHWHDGDLPVRKYAFDAAACAFMAGGVEQVLVAFGLSTDWGYLSAVFIGVFGYKVLWDILRRKVPVLSDVETKPEEPKQ